MERIDQDSTAPLSKPELSELHPRPKDYVANAYAASLDETTQRFAGAATLLLISSINSDGYIDITPRGGPPGFIHQVDNKHIALLNEPGNNKVMTLTNLAENRQVGLMFIIPGVTEVVRAYGNATSTADEAFILSLGGNPRRHKTAFKIELTKVFPHCSTALNRAGVWNSDKWPDKAAFDIPELSAMGEGLAAHRLAQE